MIFGGNTKRTLSFYAACGFMVVAMLCAIESSTGGDGTYKVIAVIALMAGGICAVGVWALGLPKSQGPDDKDWADAIR